MFRGKRAFDVVGALGGLLLFAPVMVCVAAAILLDDGGPVLFRQRRLGRGRRLIPVLKFRSMRDGRVTRVGALLRTTGLDELPQFVNILVGDLSAVGPRPITEEDAERFGYTGPSARARWSVRPGLTGLAQLAARTKTEALLLDRCYVRRPRLLFDCRIVAMSFVVNVLGKSRARRLLFGRSRGTRRPIRQSDVGSAPWHTRCGESVRRSFMPRGDKSKYTDKEKRQAEHIEKGYEARGLSERESERRAWATVNAIHGSGEKPGGSGYGKPENNEPMRRGGRNSHKKR